MVAALLPLGKYIAEAGDLDKGLEILIQAEELLVNADEGDSPEACQCREYMDEISTIRRRQEDLRRANSISRNDQP